MFIFTANICTYLCKEISLPPIRPTLQDFFESTRRRFVALSFRRVSLFTTRMQQDCMHIGSVHEQDSVSFAVLFGGHTILEVGNT